MRRYYFTFVNSTHHIMRSRDGEFEGDGQASGNLRARSSQRHRPIDNFSRGLAAFPARAPGSTGLIVPTLDEMLARDNALFRMALVKIKNRADQRKDTDRDIGAVWLIADEALRTKS
jgi:hypothetical protein